MKYMILLLCMLNFLLSVGQDVSPRDFVRLKYNKDINLYKGTPHNAYPITNQGHKYLHSKSFINGSITVQDVGYDSLLLKYDIYKQKLVLAYECYPIEMHYVDSETRQAKGNYSQNGYVIDINPTFVNEFTLGKHRFVSTGESNVNFPYLLAIPSDTFECFIGWRKEYLIDHVTWYFSDESSYVYLKDDEKYVRIFRKGAIIKRLPKPLQSEVKKYCRKIKFNVKESGVNKFYLLFRFIDDQMRNHEK